MLVGNISNAGGQCHVCDGRRQFASDFGWLRGTHERAAMLELRKKDGSIIAYPYAWLFPAKFNPSEGITLRFGREEVRIIGRNLNAEVRQGVRLFAGIVRHRVPWIQEADEAAAMAAGKGAVVVEKIKCL